MIANWRVAWTGFSRPCLFLALATAVTGAGIPVSASAQSALPTPQQIDDGRQIYEDYCVSCHGRDMVSPGLVTFDLRKFPKDDFERFRNSVLNGKGAAMPSWQGKVSDDELSRLWAYVRGGP